MKTLADRCLAIIPDTTHGLSLKDAVAKLGSDRTHTRRAFQRLQDDGRAKIAKRGKGGTLYLVHARPGSMSCAVCGNEFKRPDGSKRQTCSRACHAALRWQNATPETLAAWRAEQSRAHSTPKALARTAAHNLRRWAKPEEHEKLREQNRKRWRDPETAAVMAAKIRVNHQSPEMRKLYSEMRKEWWADPVMRKKMTDAVNASPKVQAYRNNFGEHNKKRWQNPELREKYIAANRARNTPEKRARAAERLKKFWASPEGKALRKKITATLQSKEVRERAVRARKERGWLKRDRQPNEAHP